MTPKYQIINPQRGKFIVQEFRDTWVDMHSNRVDGVGMLRAVYSSHREAMNFLRNHILELNWIPEPPQVFDENGELISK